MSFNKDAKIHKLQDENERLKKELDSLEEQLYLWEDVPDEELDEDGEISDKQVKDKIFFHLFHTGDWKLMRRIVK